MSKRSQRHEDGDVHVSGEETVAQSCWLMAEDAYQPSSLAMPLSQRMLAG